MCYNTLHFHWIIGSEKKYKLCTSIHCRQEKSKEREDIYSTHTSKEYIASPHFLLLSLFSIIHYLKISDLSYFYHYTCLINTYFERIYSFLELLSTVFFIKRVCDIRYYDWMRFKCTFGGHFLLNYEKKFMGFVLGVFLSWILVV